MPAPQLTVSVASLITFANQLRANPKNGDILAAALMQISKDMASVSQLLVGAGFSVDQLGNISLPAQDITELTTRFGYEDPAGIQYFSAVTYRIPFMGRWMRLSNTHAGTLVLTSTPTIAIPNPSIANRGPVLELLNIGANALTLQDNGTLSGSALHLGATTRTLAQRQSISLRYSNDIGGWIEQWYSAVI
jgi:hypothetical protein